MTVAVRTTHLEVWITPPPSEAVPEPAPVLDRTAFAVSCRFGFDQRYAEAEVRRTGGGTVEISYWSEIEIKISTVPGQNDPEDGLIPRFKGYVVPIDNALYPIENVLHCKGRLYRAAWVKNVQPGGTPLADPVTGTSDEAMIKAVLAACGVPFYDGNIGGTGKALGSVWLDLQQVLTPGPFTWAEGQAGLDAIHALDEVSVPDTHPTTGPYGRYRTVETSGGVVFRAPYKTHPGAFVDAGFAEGVDVLDARIGRDPAGAANRVTVTGAAVPTAVPAVGGAGTDVTFSTACRFTVASAFAPYLPPGLPAGPEGFPVVNLSFASPLLEKGTIAEPGDVLSCQAVADFLLQEHNTVLDTLEFATPRDDLLNPGWTVHLDSPRLGLTDPTRHYWIQHLEVVLDERGAFTQRLRCLRRS